MFNEFFCFTKQTNCAEKSTIIAPFYNLINLFNIGILDINSLTISELINIINISSMFVIVVLKA